MNNEFIDRLWAAAYKLRGASDMPELCRLMIFAMFIKYIDLENTKDEDPCMQSYDDRFSVGYLALTYGKKVSADRLIEYINNIEGDLLPKNGTISGESEELPENGIIAAELKELLEKSKDSQLQVIFKAIDEAGFENNSQLYETALLLLEKLSRQHGNLRNDTSSSLSLCRLEGRLLDCQEGMSVYDGFCGNGISINEAADGGCILYLQDINQSAASVACIMARLKGNKIGTAKCENSLASPISLEKYDRVICEPPFVSKYDSSTPSIPAGNCLYPEISDDASIALRHALAHLKDNGTAVVLVPMSVLVNYKSICLREKLIETFLDAVIELPADAGPMAALLVLKKDSKRKNIYFLDAKNFFKKGWKNQSAISDESINRIIEMYKNREKSEGISIDLDKGKIDKNKKSLSVSQYVVSDTQNSIMIGDTSAHQQEYRRLMEQLTEIDGRLDAIRGRFL